MPALQAKQAEAEEQIRKVHLKKVEWAIAFSQTSLRGLKANQLLQVKKCLHKFLYGDQQFLPGADERQGIRNSTAGIKYILQTQMESFANKLSVRQLHKVHDRLFASLRELVYHAPNGTLIMSSREAAFFFRWSSMQSPFVWDIRVFDVVPASIIALGAHLVGSRITPDHLRRCPGSDCGIIFLASRKPRADRKLYCPSGCSVRAAQRRYREKNRPSIQQKDRNRSKRRYHAKVHQKFPGARIGRR